MTEKIRHITENSRKSQAMPSLGRVLEGHLRDYFSAHDDAVQPRNLYNKVIGEIEKTLINETLSATRGNQIKAAQILGINRNTLRKKILAKGIKIKSKSH